MKFSRKILMLLSALSITVAMAACQSSSSAEEVLVYNWGEYIDTDVLKEFEEETGIRVRYDTFPSNEEMYNKIKAGGSFYDVIIPSDYMIEKMINEDMLEKIDMNNVPNYKNIDDLFKGLPYDSNNEYSVAYMWGTVGILYNTDMVDEPIESWNALWDEKYTNQIFMYDSVRDSIGAALKKLGYGLNTRSESELLEARDELIRQVPLVQAYLGDSIRDKMIGNEGALAVVYSGDAMYSQSLNEQLNYVVPVEGSNYWFDGMAIPKGAKNKSNAEKFIDFMCRPDIAARNSEYIGYSTANNEALSLLDPEMVNNPIYWPDQSILDNCELYLDLGEYTEMYHDIWTQILVSSSN